MKNFLVSLLLFLHLREPPAKPDPAEKALPGWSEFRFGMTPEKILAIPGYDFPPYLGLAPVGEDLGALAPKNPALLYGLPYRLALFFSHHQAPGRRELIPPQTLGDIVLRNETPASQQDCEDAFLLLLARLEKRYGKFGPLYPEQKQNPKDRLSMSVAWKSTKALSRYQLVTVFLPQETAYVRTARRGFASRYVDLTALWSARQEGDPSTCLTILDFKRL